MIDLCAGIGGFSLAATWAGMTIAGQVEIDPYCRRVLEKHWPNVPRMNDVFDVEGHEFGTVDIIAGGFPCQPYSVAGKRGGGSDDRAIWPEIARIVATARPRWCLFENVPGIIGISHMGLDDVLADLEEIGYAARPVVIPACAVNAPHRRDRVWILGHANESGPQGREQRSERAGERTTWSAGGQQTDATDSADMGRPARTGREPGQPTEQRWDGPDNGCGLETEQRLGLENDGTTRRLAGRGLMDERWRGDPMNAFGADWEDGVPRVVATERDRVNKLKALGNAIVPQVAYQVLMAMEDV